MYVAAVGQCGIQGADLIQHRVRGSVMAHPEKMYRHGMWKPIPIEEGGKRCTREGYRRESEEKTKDDPRLHGHQSSDDEFD